MRKALRVADTTICKGLARLDRNLPEVNVPFRLDRWPNVIFLADRDPTRRHNQIVVVRRCAQGCASISQRVVDAPDQ